MALSQNFINDNEGKLDEAPRQSFLPSNVSQATIPFTRNIYHFGNRFMKTETAGFDSAGKYHSIFLDPFNDFDESNLHDYRNEEQPLPLPRFRQRPRVSSELLDKTSNPLELYGKHCFDLDVKKIQPPRDSQLLVHHFKKGIQRTLVNIPPIKPGLLISRRTVYDPWTMCFLNIIQLNSQDDEARRPHSIMKMSSSYGPFLWVGGENKTVEIYSTYLKPLVECNQNEESIEVTTEKTYEKVLTLCYSFLLDIKYISTTSLKIGDFLVLIIFTGQHSFILDLIKIEATGNGPTHFKRVLVEESQLKWDVSLVLDKVDFDFESEIIYILTRHVIYGYSFAGYELFRCSVTKDKRSVNPDVDNKASQRRTLTCRDPTLAQRFIANLSKSVFLVVWWNLPSYQVETYSIDASGKTLMNKFFIPTKDRHYLKSLRTLQKFGKFYLCIHESEKQEPRGLTSGLSRRRYRSEVNVYDISNGKVICKCNKDGIYKVLGFNWNKKELAMITEPKDSSKHLFEVKSLDLVEG